MFINITKHILFLFLVGSPLVALASDNIQLNALMKSHIASIVPKKYLMFIVASGTESVNIYDESNRYRLMHLGITPYHCKTSSDDLHWQEILITKKQLEAINNSNVDLLISSLIISDDPTINISWLDNIENIVLSDFYPKDTDAYKGLGLLFYHNAHLPLVLKFAPNVTSTPFHSNIPNNVNHLHLIGEVEKIGDKFLQDCTDLKSLDLSGLSNVKVIGDKFLQGCTGLKSLDLSGLSNVEVIGENFLYGCTGLTSLDLSPFSKVTRFDEDFLRNCTSLTTLDLSGLSQVIDIEDGFLSDCASLTTLDFSPLSNVKIIRYYFLSGCTNLTELDFSPLSNVKIIEDFFLSGCTNLTELDFSPLSNVKIIGNSFLSGCAGLTSLNFSPFSNVKIIGHSFLSGCAGLTSLDLSPFSKITRFSRQAFDGCTGLTSIIAPNGELWVKKERG